MRVACLLIPDLPLRAELRAHPELHQRPVAIATGPDARAEVISASPEARALGLLPPCRVSHARSLCRELAIRVTSPALERTTREALMDLALSFSPRAALAPREAGFFFCEGAVFLDASGVASLYRSEGGFAAALSARAQAVGLPGPIAIASSRATARTVARKLSIPLLHHRAVPGDEAGEPEVAILEPGEEARVLAPLSIDLLGPSDALAERLTRFGVHTVRDLLALPRGALAQRLGPEVLALVARARGREAEPPLPEPRDLRVREAMDLDHPIATLEPLSFVLRGMLSRLTERLILRGLASGPIDLALELCGGGRDHRRIGLAAATRDHRVLLRLVAQALESHPPEAPIEAIGVSTLGVVPRSDQLDLFRNPGPDPAEVDRTLAELEALCGPGRVGAPAVVDDHHPCAFEIEPFSTDGARSDGHPLPAGSSLPADGSSFADGSPFASSADGSRVGDCLTNPSPYANLAVRALRPPVRAEVRLRGQQPQHIRSAVACGDVLGIAGPWRSTGRWWSEEGRFALDHFDVQVSDGTILRLCFDWLARRWQIDAIYD